MIDEVRVWISLFKEGGCLSPVDIRWCFDVSIELYGHVHLLCQYIPENQHGIVFFTQWCFLNREAVGCRAVTVFS